MSRFLSASLASLTVRRQDDPEVRHDAATMAWFYTVLANGGNAPTMCMSMACSVNASLRGFQGVRPGPMYVQSAGTYWAQRDAETQSVRGGEASIRDETDPSAPRDVTGAANPLNGEAFLLDGSGYIVAPLGVDVRGNIGVAESHRDDAFIAKNWWFKSMVQNKGPWDYKQRSPSFEDFGNWHYGVVGAAVGFEKHYLLQAAGFAQVQAGTSPPDSGKPGIPGIPWTGTPPYGDDDRDQYFISMGYVWYQDQKRGGEGQ